MELSVLNLELLFRQFNISSLGVLSFSEDTETLCNFIHNKVMTSGCKNYIKGHFLQYQILSNKINGGIINYQNPSNNLYL